MSNSDPTLFERLAKVEPAKLARLLVELAAQDQTILEQVQFLLASGDTTAIAKAVRSTLRAWKRSPRFIHYQEAFAFGEQLDRLLDSVEDGLLGPDPALALDLLEEFLQSDRWILERVDDSAGCIGTAYRRACQLFARAAPGVASPAALAERIALLVEKDDYGVRHSLLEHVPQFLDSETIARLVDRWRKQAAQGPGSRRDRMPLLRIETLAASTGDPQLYAEAALEGRSVEDQPVIGLQVARQFVLAGRPAEALQYLCAEDKVPPHCFDEYAETLDRVYEALGRTDDLRELRKRHFLHRPDPERLERYLGGLERVLATSNRKPPLRAFRYQMDNTMVNPFYSRSPGFSNPVTAWIGCYWLLGVVVGDGVAAPVAGGAGVMLKVSIRIFQSSPSRITVQYALDVVRTPVLALNSRTPFSGRPNLIASRAYNVRGILIDREEFVA